MKSEPPGGGMAFRLFIAVVGVLMSATVAGAGAAARGEVGFRLDPSALRWPITNRFAAYWRPIRISPRPAVRQAIVDQLSRDGRVGNELLVLPETPFVLACIDDEAAVSELARLLAASERAGIDEQWFRVVAALAYVPGHRSEALLREQLARASDLAVAREGRHGRVGIRRPVLDSLVARMVQSAGDPVAELTRLAQDQHGREWFIWTAACEWAGLAMDAAALKAFVAKAIDQTDPRWLDRVYETDTPPRVRALSEILRFPKENWAISRDLLVEDKSLTPAGRAFVAKAALVSLLLEADSSTTGAITADPRLQHRIAESLDGTSHGVASTAAILIGGKAVDASMTQEFAQWLKAAASHVRPADRAYVEYIIDRLADEDDVRTYSVVQPVLVGDDRPVVTSGIIGGVVPGRRPDASLGQALDDLDRKQ